MVSVIGVRFKDVGKVYYFDPDGVELKVGDNVIVETRRGVECGKVALANRQLSDDKVTAPLKKMIRSRRADSNAGSTRFEKRRRGFKRRSGKQAQHADGAPAGATEGAGYFCSGRSSCFSAGFLSVHRPADGLDC